MNRIKLLNVFFTLILCSTGLMCAYSQDLPEKTVPPRLVNDFAGLLSSGEQNMNINWLLLMIRHQHR